MTLWWLTLLPALAQTPTPEPETVPEVVTAPEEVTAPGAHLVYTGGAGAIGAERYQFAVHEELARVAAERDAQLVADHPIHGVFHQGAHAVWAEDGRVASTSALVEGTPACEVLRTGTTLETHTERVLLPDTDLTDAFATIPRVDAQAVTWRRCVAGDIAGYWVGPADSDDIAWSIDAFTVRLAATFTLTSGETTEALLVLGLPQQEAGRRIRAIRDAIDAVADAAYVDAGEFLPGASSVAFGAMSLHRKTGLDALSRLTPTALVPGASELAPGPAALLAEADEYGLPYVVTNWVAEEETLAMPASLRATVGASEVAFLGFIDPAYRQIGVDLEGSGVALSDPVTAVNDEARRLAEESNPPDLVVLVGLVTPAMRTQLSEELRGVDLVIGDHITPIRSLDRLAYDLSEDHQRDRQPAVLLPVDGVSSAALRLVEGTLAGVEVATIPVSADLPTDDEVSARITAVRAEVYPGRDEVLVPTTTADPLATVAPETLDRLVCEAVLEASGADIAFLPPLADAAEVPGSLTELQVADRLAMLDRLEVHRIDGNRMENFLFQVQGEVDNHCGANVGVRFAKVRGWFIDANRTYKVVTTDRLRENTGLGDILKTGSSDLALHYPKFQPLQLDEGQMAMLSGTALAKLREWRAAGGEAWVEEVVSRSPGDKVPLWLVDVDRLSFRTSSFRRPPRPDSYVFVPETKINSPSSFTLGADLDIGLAYTDARVWWDVRGRASYTRLALANEPPQETADDWRASTSLSLPRLAFPTAANLQFMPYGEVLLDSEFTPLGDGTGTTIPRQADLSLTMGLSAIRWRWIRALRLGAFINQDLGRLPNNVAGVAEKSPEYGSRIAAETRHDFFSASSLRLETFWDAMVFGNTPQDDAADLRVRLEAEARLKLRLVRWLDGALFVDGFLVQGRVDETRTPAGAVTVGAALDMAAAFRL